MMRGPVAPCCAITDPIPSYFIASVASGFISPTIIARTGSSAPGGPAAFESLSSRPTTRSPL